MFPSFELFGKTFGLYPIMAIVGGLLAGALACRKARARGLDDNEMILLLLAAAAGALVGGSLLYGMTNWRYLWALFDNLDKLKGPGQLFSILGFIFGGSVFYGGLAGSCAAGFVMMRARRLDMRAYTDMLAPSTALFHVFGRVGCFLAGCCYGVECQHGVVFTRSPAADANGVPRFPVQLAEALFELSLFFLLSRLYKKGEMRGRLFALYLMIYPVGRFFLELLRGDGLRGSVFGLSTSQLISVPLFAGALLWLALSARGGRAKTQR